jgi:hypothetical protein
MKQGVGIGRTPAAHLYPITRDTLIQARQFHGAAAGSWSIRFAESTRPAAGLKVGMHMLCNFVSKNDALVRPKPDPRLYKDARAVMSMQVPADLVAGDSVEADGSGELRIYDAFGTRKQTLQLPRPLAMLPRGKSAIRLVTHGPAAVHLRVENKGKPERFPSRRPIRTWKERRSPDRRLRAAIIPGGRKPPFLQRAGRIRFGYAGNE